MSLKSFTLIVVLNLGYVAAIGQSLTNQFAAETDTLLIRTTKNKGFGKFSFFGGFLDFQDTTNLFGFPIELPIPLNNVTGIRILTDLRSDLDFIDIIKGELPSGEVALIVDQNNNQSFMDDELITLHPIEWNASIHSIPVTFLVSNGEKIVEHESWIRMGSWGNLIIQGRDEHLKASFSIDNQNFEVGIIDPPFSGTFTYGSEPQIALLSSSKSVKDSIQFHDLINRDEYLILNDNYYRFDSINNDGSVIRLIKETNFETQTGIQVGMLAPDFNFKTTNGELKNSNKLHDKPIIVANSCGCGGDTKSTQAYFDIQEAYHDKAYVLRLDSYSEMPQDDWTINMEDEFNKAADIQYRKAYCSRICFVIGANQHILSKFKITDWETYLPNVFEN